MKFPTCTTCGQTITFVWTGLGGPIESDDFKKCADFAMFVHNEANHIDHHHKDCNCHHLTPTQPEKED